MIASPTASVRRRVRCVFALSLILWVDVPAPAQGTFQNLDFEAARIIPIEPPPVPQFYIAASNALPGWSASHPIVFHNTISLGAAAISIHDQESSWHPLSGNYSVFLQGSSDGQENSYIWQIGTIPDDAKSLRFLSDDPGTLARIFASFNQEEIPVSLIEPEFPYLLGGDISQFAGQTGELRFWGGAMLDSISFSPQPIPEPGAPALVLLALGIMLAISGTRRFLGFKRDRQALSDGGTGL